MKIPETAMNMIKDLVPHPTDLFNAIYYYGGRYIEGMLDYECTVVYPEMITDKNKIAKLRLLDCIEDYIDAIIALDNNEVYITGYVVRTEDN